MHRTLATLLLGSCLVPLVPACTNAVPALPQTRAVPISGGTLAITSDGFAVAADPDRDVVWLADLVTRDVAHLALAEGDEPGRVVLDAAGRAHVALRRGGALVSFPARAGGPVDRRAVCPAPRGLAYDAAKDLVHVACAGGELVSLPAAGGAPVRSLRLDRDLRDVVVQGDTLLVSRFRAAELLVVNAAGEVTNRTSPLPTISSDTSVDGTSVTNTPVVAYRTVALPDGSIAMAHQMATSTTIGTDSGAYGWGGACGGPVVSSAVTFFTNTGELGNPLPLPAFVGALPVDVAVGGDGQVAVVVAGGTQVVFLGGRSDLDSSASTDPCANSDLFEAPPNSVTLGTTPTAIAAWNGRLFVQTRERARIVEVDAVNSVTGDIELGGPLLESYGNAIFHEGWSGVACASCHPEGNDDGHTWFFDKFGARRTQNLSGGVSHKAPFHWRGEIASGHALIEEVLVNRMSGDDVGLSGSDALFRWLDTVAAPAPSPTGTSAQIAHGKQLFEDTAVGCSGCHSGTYLTNNQRVDAGTGNTFQVPGLIGIAARAPYFHDGCAATLQDRFDPSKSACNGGDAHGHTSQLAAADVADLIAYLETL